jgi:hypothetical protein
MTHDENLYLCTTCQRHFDIGPVMLKLASNPEADWDAPLHCPRCDATTIRSASRVAIYELPRSLN